MTATPARVATASQTVGPFFHFALTSQPIGRMTDRFPGGERLWLVIRVTDGDGEPVTDGLVELRQAGVFGRLPTGEDGSCEFETVKPGSVPDGRPVPHAPYIGVCFFARGLLRQLHTRIYLAADPSLGADPVLRLVPEPRRKTLLARPVDGAAERWLFDLHLQGEQETVFFDV